MLSPTPSGVASARTGAPRKETSPQFGPKRKLSGPRLHLTPQHPSTPPHARQAARPAPAWPPGAQRRGRNKFNYYRNRGWGASARDRGRGRLGAHSPLLGPDAPVPAARACRPAGEPSGAPRKIRPSSAAVPPGGPGGPEGARGGPGCGGRARLLRRPPARGLTGAPTPPHPTPARAGRTARPAPAPAAPPPGGPPSSTVCAPQAPESPAPATPAPAPLTLSFSARGLARAGESPASRKRARRPPCLRGPARRPTGARGCGPGLGPPLLTFQLLFFFSPSPLFPRLV